jgi:hypothetical protein
MKRQAPQRSIALEEARRIAAARQLWLSGARLDPPPPSSTQLYLTGGIPDFLLEDTDQI